MSRRLLAILIAGAVAAVTAMYRARPSHRSTCQQCSPPQPSGVSLLVAGIAAWLPWLASRLGLLFTIVDYVYLLPAAKEDTGATGKGAVGGG